ncbi:MAG: ABC transporter substrate-binding protein [Defluviitaleaceae bacterium]|nr:ABC transporter substrate-binding protein [Defluviitaleaceae bacterium]
MKRNFMRVCLTVLALSLVFVFAGCNDAGASGDSDVMNIGMIAPLTGGTAMFGVAASDGATLAFEQINAAGGLLDQQVNFRVYDDENSTPMALQAYERHVYNNNVVAIVGPVTSGPANAVAGAAQAHGLPMISPTATAEAVTRGRDFMFRACFLDALQARAIAYFAINHLEAETASILYNVGMDYSRGLQENFTRYFEAMGGTVIHSLAFSTGDIDFRSQLTTISSGNPDILFLPEYFSNVGLQIVQARDLGISATLIGGDGWEGVLDAVPDPAILDGTFFSAHFAPDDPDPIVQNFVRSYTERFDIAPSSFAALGFDAANILAQAIETAGTTERGAVINAMQNIDFYGVTGNITFDEHGNPIKPIVVVAISTQGGETAARLYHRFEAEYSFE